MWIHRRKENQAHFFNQTVLSLVELRAGQGHALPVHPNTISLTVPRGHRGYFDESLNLETGAQILCTHTTRIPLCGHAHSWPHMLTHSSTLTQVHTPTYSHSTVTPAVTCSQMFTYTHTHTPALMHAYTCSHACTHTHTHAFTSSGTHTNSLCPCRHTHVLIPAHTHSYNHTLCALPWESGGLTALSADIRQVQLEEVRPPPPGNSQSSSILSSKRVEADGDPCGPGPGSDTHSGIPAGHWPLRA